MGLDINLKVGYDRRTVLVEAASEGHEVMVQLLLNCGTDVNAKDRMANTALDLAVLH